MTVNVVPDNSQYPMPSAGEPTIRAGARPSPAGRKDVVFHSDGDPIPDEIRVLIADDCPAEMAVLQHGVRAASDITVVAGAFNGSDAFIKAARTQPGVILMDSQMPETDGLETARRIKELLPASKILFLGEHPSDIAPALSTGADAFLLKDCSQDELLSAISALARERHSARTVTVPVFEKTPDHVSETKVGTNF